MNDSHGKPPSVFNPWEAMKRGALIRAVNSQLLLLVLVAPTRAGLRRMKFTYSSTEAGISILVVRRRQYIASCRCSIAFFCVRSRARKRGIRRYTMRPSPDSRLVSGLKLVRP
jgi:hypothetical protein